MRTQETPDFYRELAELRFQERVSNPQLDSFARELSHPYQIDNVVRKYMEWFNDPSINGTLSPNLPKKRAKIRKWLLDERDNPASRRFFVKPFEYGRIIGHMGASEIDQANRSATIGFVNCDHSYKGWGIMKRALQELRYLLEPEVDVLHASVQVGNLGSIGVLRYNDFIQVGERTEGKDRKMLVFEGRTEKKPQRRYIDDAYGCL